VRLPIHTAWQTHKALGNGRDLRVQDGHMPLLRPVKSKCRAARTLSSWQSLKAHDRRGLVRSRCPLLTSADSDIKISPPGARFGGRRGLIIDTRARPSAAPSISLRHDAHHRRAYCGSCGHHQRACWCMPTLICWHAGVVLPEVARGPTSTSSHASCTHRLWVLDSLILVWLAPSARINRVRMMGPPSHRARSGRRSRDLCCGCHSSPGK
jgi:hypothetical protein